MTGACEVWSPRRPLYEEDEKLLRESSALGPSIGRAFLLLALSVEVCHERLPSSLSQVAAATQSRNQ